MSAAEENKHRLFAFLNELNAELEVMDGQICLLGQELTQTSKVAALRQEKASKMQQVS